MNQPGLSIRAVDKWAEATVQMGKRIGGRRLVHRRSKRGRRVFYWWRVSRHWALRTSGTTAIDVVTEALKNGISGWRPL